MPSSTSESQRPQHDATPLLAEPLSDSSTSSESSSSTSALLHQPTICNTQTRTRGPVEAEYIATAPPSAVAAATSTTTRRKQNNPPPPVQQTSVSRGEYVPSGPPLMHQYVVVMRHGERRDSLPEAPNEADPPLTEAGKRAVSNVTQRLKQQIGVKSSKQLMIVSSPFVRTMETAAELQRYDIGVDRPATIDNTLCEVFGPVRVKGCASAPDVCRKDAVGDLPHWGESMQDANDRFVNSFKTNANRFRSEHIILVSHGDAISAVLSHFYPKRVVYSADFLSFIVLRRVHSTSDHFTLHGSFGVEWMLDGEEEEEPLPPPSSPEKAKPHPHPAVAHSSPSHRTRSGTYGSNDISASARESHHSKDGSVHINVQQHSGQPDDSLGEAGVAQGTPMPKTTTNNNNNKMRTHLIHGLHMLIVFSQFPTLRIWTSVRDASVYILNVTALEIVSLRYGWRTVVDRLPFGFGSPRRRILYRLARYPLARTLWKLVTLFVMYVVTAVPIGWIAGSNAGSVMQSFGADAWNALIMSCFVLLDLWRGYLDNSAEADDDPHRESI